MAKRRGRGRRGDGHVEELPSGKFRVVLSLGRDPVTGKRKKLQETFDTMKAALAWKAERKTEHARGRLADCGRMTVAAWAATFLEFKKARVCTRSWEPYEQHTRMYITPHLGGVPLASLQPHHVADFYATLSRLGVSAAQQRNVGKTLRVMLREAQRQRLITASPAGDVARLRAVPGEMQVWDTDEVRRFLAAARGDRLETLFLLALDTGARQGELLALCWSEVDLTAGAIRILYTLEEPKGAALNRKEVKTPCSRRRVALSAAALAALREHREALRLRGLDTVSGPVFPNRRDSWLQPSHVRKRDFARVVRRAGVRRIRFHDLRHTHASLSLAAGASLKAVSSRLGHHSAAFTLKTYVHFLPEQEQAILGFWGNLLNSVRDADGFTAPKRHSA
jgi:integrase